MIRVYDEAGNVIEKHEHKGDFKEYYLDKDAIALKSYRRIGVRFV